MREAEPGQQLARRGRRADAHDARRARPRPRRRAMRARGLRPCAARRASLATSSAQAPSLTPEALPAVTVPPARNGVAELRERLEARLARMLVACRRRPGRPSSRAASPATISAARRPLACAASARCWLRSANASWSARDTSKSAATFSPVSGIESMPYCSFMQRVDEAPADRRVVTSAGCARRRRRPSTARRARGSCSRRRPRSRAPPRPTRIGRAAIATASSPEPHRRFTVTPGTSTGRPASSARHARDVAVVLAGLVGAAVDHVVDRLPSRRPALRSMSAAIGSAARSSVRTPDERAAVAADRRADGVADEGLAHRSPVSSRQACRWLRPRNSATVSPRWFCHLDLVDARCARARQRSRRIARQHVALARRRQELDRRARPRPCCRRRNCRRTRTRCRRARR